MIVELRFLVAILLVSSVIGLYFLIQDRRQSVGSVAQNLPIVDLPIVAGLESVQFTHAAAAWLQKHLETVIIGQRGLVNGLILGLLAGKHVFVQSLPGMAKTTAIKTLAQIAGLSFGRIQGTPDLLPSDIIGVEVLKTTAGAKTVRKTIQKGPIFANIVLFDEINRTTPKVQSALMECMEEHQVTIGHHTLVLPKPFVVFATANPAGSKGVYDLPEAQLDRFGMSIVVQYPDNEREIVKDSMGNDSPMASCTIHFNVLHAQIERIAVSDEIIDYVTSIIQKTRVLSDYIIVGCSPRAGKDLLFLSRVLACLMGGDCVTKENVQMLIPNVLFHRMARKKNADRQSVLHMLIA